MRRSVVAVRGSVALGSIAMVAVLALAGCGKSIQVTDSSSSGSSAAGVGAIQLVAGSPPAGTGASASGAPASGASASGASASGPVAGQVTIGQVQKPAASIQLTAATNSLGGVVVDGDGRSLYRFDEDSPRPPRTTCTQACQVTWPPLIVQAGGRVYGNGVDTAAIGTVTRPDGAIQITVGGWPLYYFSGDHRRGDINGQGVKGTWFAVAPNGAKVGARAGSTSGTAPGSAPGSATGATAGPATGSGGQGAALSLQRTSLGSAVAVGSGRTVYVSDRDQDDPPKAVCAGSCLRGFTPVPAVGDVPVGIAGFSAEQLGSVRRDDGTAQLTLSGFPLYTNDQDQRPGDVNGRGRPGWFLLVLDGRR